MSKRINWVCTILKFTLFLPLLVVLSIGSFAMSAVWCIFELIRYVFVGNINFDTEKSFLEDVLAFWNPTYKN